MKDAGVTPEEIDYVNAHGTGTHLNDLTETAALKLAMGEAAYHCKVNSTKSMVGHLLGARRRCRSDCMCEGNSGKLCTQKCRSCK